MSEPFIKLNKVAEHHFQLNVEPKHCTPVDFLYGGTSLGVAVKALEEQCQRPVLWTNAQFFSYAHPGDVLDVKIEEVTVGHKVTQARLRASVGDKEIYSAAASLGARNDNNDGQWEVCPEVLPVEDCDPHKLPLPTEMDKDHIHKHQEFLLPFNHELKKPDGKHIVWVKVKNAEQNDASTLAVIADMATASANYVLDVRAGGSSLDNTIRINKLVPTEWVLFDSQVQGIHNGIATVSVRMWSQDKTLMAVASQTFIVREFGKKK